MYKNIMIPVAPDHPERLAEQLSVAKALADSGAKMTVVSVIEAVPLYIAAEVPAVVFEVVHGHAPTLILDKIKEDGTDLVIVRSHKPDLSDWFLGSTAGRVVRHAPCAVHVIR